MNLLENKRFTLWAFSLLIILNLVLIALVVLPRIDFFKNIRQNQPGRDIFTKELGFTQDQLIQFKALQSEHFQQVRALQSQVNEKRKSMFSLMSSVEQDSEEVARLANEIGSLVTEIEINTYQHFDSLRAICTPDQLPKFEAFIKQVADRRMFQDRRPMRKNTRDRESRPPPPQN